MSYVEVVCSSWIADNNNVALRASETALCALKLVHLCAPACFRAGGVMHSTGETPLEYLQRDFALRKEMPRRNNYRNNDIYRDKCIVDILLD